jgi:hypothetical protein
MLRRLLTSALVLGSAVTFIAPSANAQSVNVPFSGTMTANCTFGNPAPGILFPVGTTTLAANASAGARVSLNCSAPANITISAPLQTSGTTLSPTNCSADFTSNAGVAGGPAIAFPSCVGTSAPTSISGLSSLRVGMSVTDTNGIPPGDYSYNVTLTLTP